MKPRPAASRAGRIGAAPTPDPLLDLAGAVSGERVLMLGADLGIMCALIGRGCASVTELHRTDRPEAQSADLVILPDIRDPHALDGAVAQARRALTGGGRLLARTRVMLAPALALALRAHGFGFIQASRSRGATVLRAALPATGMVGHA